MIGRQTELAQLQHLWRRASTSGQAQWALVGGDAGLGKTTLLDSLVADLGEAGVVLRGNCLPLGGEGFPYAPIVGWLRSLIRTYGSDVVQDWAGTGWDTLGILLPGVGPTGGDGDLERLRLSEAVSVVLEQASRVAPLLIMVEDLHWADTTTGQLIRFLTSSLADAPLLLVGTWRTDEMHRRHPMRSWLTEMGRLAEVSRLELEPLDQREAVDLVRRTAPIDVPVATLAAIIDRAEGIPYFLSELALTAGDGPQLPWTLRDALTARVHGLGEDLQRVLRLATGAGTRVDHGMLAAIVQTPDSGIDDDRLDELLREAIDAALLAPDDEGGYVFRHALLAEAIAEDQLPGEQRRMHARYAALLAEHPEWDHGGQRARHLLTSGPVSEAFVAAIEAARSPALAQAESLAMLTHALDLWDQVPDAAKVAGSHHALLAETALQANLFGDMERGLTYIDASIAEGRAAGASAAELSERFTLRGRLLSNLLRTGALESMQQAVDLTDPQAPDVARLRALDGLATVQMLEGEFAAAEQSAAEALAISDLVGAESLRRSALNTYAICRVTFGHEEEGLDLMRQARSPDEDLIDLRYFINHSNELDVIGRFQESAEVAFAGLEQSRRAGREWGFATMLIGNAIWPLLQLGRLDEAERLIARPRPFGAVSGSHQLHLQLVEALVPAWHGRQEETIDALQSLVPQTAGTQRQYRMQYAHVMALVQLWAGHPEAVADLVAPIWAEPVRHKGELVRELAHLAAWAGRELGDPSLTDDAWRAVSQAWPASTAERWDTLIEAETLNTISGWEAAAATATGPGIPVWIRPHVDVQLIGLLLEAGDRSTAADHLTEALARVEHLALVPYVERLSDLRTRAGLAPRTRSPGLLTRRESEVLALVAAGRSNRQVAEELFISTKTASVHVTNILAKLQVHSRGEAAAVGRQRGLV